VASSASGTPGPPAALLQAAQPDPGRFLEAARVTAWWRFEGGAESVTVHPTAGQARVHRCAAPSGEARALLQLAGPDTAGDSLPDARAVARLTAQALASLPHRLPPGRRRFALARYAAAHHPDDPLAPLGLRGRLPDAVDAALLPFGPEVHVERRDRRVMVSAQDVWIDRRDTGLARVELYLSRDPELARQAARLQADEDPTAHLAQLGALLGYPPCCVAAFAAQDDRANNTRNRYASAARTRAQAPWPWPLNNLNTRLLPFYPCRYECPLALAQAQTALGAMAESHPAMVAPLAEALALPVLYFEHDRQVILHGEATPDGGVRFGGVSTPPHPWFRGLRRRHRAGRSPDPRRCAAAAEP
jgi:hypothetical protein